MHKLLSKTNVFEVLIKTLKDQHTNLKKQVTLFLCNPLISLDSPHGTFTLFSNNIPSSGIPSSNQKSQSLRYTQAMHSILQTFVYCGTYKNFYIYLLHHSKPFTHFLRLYFLSANLLSLILMMISGLLSLTQSSPKFSI